MPVRTHMLRAAMLCLLVLPAGLRAEGIDTEHLFGFMIGSDVGAVGERELQSETAGRFSKNGGRYRGLSQEFELEFVPAENFRVELGTTFAAHDIRGVPGLDDRRQLAWQGLSLDVRYRFLDRDVAPFGFTVAVETEANHIDDTSGAPARNYGSEVRLAFDREIVPGRIIAALNLSYQPEWTRLNGSGLVERESAIGAALAVMAQIRPAVFVGAEARYLRTYDGIGLDTLAGQALFIGPTAYVKLSESTRLTLAWSAQAWGRDVGSTAALDLVHFERHQVRLVYGVNF